MNITQSQLDEDMRVDIEVKCEEWLEFIHLGMQMGLGGDRLSSTRLSTDCVGHFDLSLAKILALPSNNNQMELSDGPQVNMILELVPVARSKPTTLRSFPTRRKTRMSKN